AHATRLGEGQRLPVMGLTALRIEAVGMSRNVAEQLQRVGQEIDATRCGINRAVAQALRLVQPAEQQTGASQRIGGPTVPDSSPRRLTLEELLAFPQPVERLGRVAEICQGPGGVRERSRK